MKNMKIKSYTFKKNSVLNKEAKLNQNTNSKGNIEYATINNNALTDVEKILKSPSVTLQQNICSCPLSVSSR